MRLVDREQLFIAHAVTFENHNWLIGNVVRKHGGFMMEATRNFYGAKEGLGPNPVDSWCVQDGIFCPTINMIYPCFPNGERETGTNESIQIVFGKS